MKFDVERDKTFEKKFMLSMLIFLLLIAIQTFSLELLDMPVWLQVVVTLLPMTPLVWAFQIYRSRFLLLDEYMQRLTGEAFLWSMGIVGFLSCSYGMLEMKFVIPDISLSYILPAIFGGHGLVLQVLLKADSNEE
tara:strand:- start:127 stop:531 length:405 start_codon:yes stop_codon:yes gene_type:complete